MIRAYWQSAMARLMAPAKRARRTRLFSNETTIQEREESSQKRFRKGTSGDDLVRCLDARGIAYRYVRNDEITVSRLAGATILSFVINGATYYFCRGGFFASDTKRVPGPNVNGTARRLVAWKPLANALLRSQGFSVPESVCLPRSAKRQAETFFLHMVPAWPQGCVLKPVNGKWGRHVHTSIRDLKSFRRAFRDVAGNYETIMIERMVTGIVYRFFCVAGRVVAIRFARTANVEGDGVHTIGELVEMKNALRKAQPGHDQFPLRLRRDAFKLLKTQGLSVQSVLKSGQIAWLSKASNLHQGAEINDATDDVHPSYVDLVQRGVRSFDGLNICGADLAIDDARISATGDNYHFIELNAFPGFSTHYSPWTGKPRDVAGAIVDFLHEETMVSKNGEPIHPLASNHE